MITGCKVYRENDEGADLRSYRVLCTRAREAGYWRHRYNPAYGIQEIADAVRCRNANIDNPAHYNVRWLRGERE
jgi:hypothetical protein